MSLSEAAPLPLQWSQRTFFLIMNYTGLLVRVLKKNEARLTSMLAPVYLEWSVTTTSRKKRMETHMSANETSNSVTDVGPFLT